MRLKALELQGFKSFPDKTVITFDRGITVVVGPNGSGKSNIADAMRWVLGEMSSKNIRGGKMEDVVFAGSQKRSPMGYAEVSVTFDNSEDGGKIASLAEYDEFTVTRRYYRIGDSEYFINRKPVRLRDIHELFLNTGLGKDGYSIIGQGKIAEIISQKNEERRAIFEEAAGIAKYRYQKNEAQKKLENTDENLVRIEDIASVLEERVGPLEKEADKAKTYLALREEKMTLDVSLSVYDIQTAKATTDELSGRLLLAKEELESADEARASFESAEEKAREEDMQNKITTEKLSARLLSLTSSLHENESKIKLCENDAAHLRETVVAAGERIRASEDNLKLSEEEYQKLCEEREKAEKNRENLTKEAETLKQSMEKTEDALSANAGFSAVCEARMEELRREQTDAFVAASVAEAKKEADLKRTAEIAQSIEKLEGDIRFFDTRIETAEHKIADLTAKENAIKEKLDTLDRERLQNEKDQREMGEKKNAFFLDISQRKHKIQNLVRMEELLEGYSGAVRFLVNEHKEGRGNNHNTINGQALEHGQRHVTGSGRHIDKHIVHIFPNHIGPELLYRAGNDGTTPDHRIRAVIQQQIDGHNLDAGTSHGRIQAFLRSTLALADAKGSGCGRTGNIRIQNANPLALLGHSNGQHGSHSRLANAALTGYNSNHLFNIRFRIRRSQQAFLLAIAAIRAAAGSAVTTTRTHFFIRSFRNNLYLL